MTTDNSRNLAEELREEAASYRREKEWDKADALWFAADTVERALPPEVWEKKIERVRSEREKLSFIQNSWPYYGDDEELTAQIQRWEQRVADEELEIIRLCPVALQSRNPDSE